MKTKKLSLALIISLVGFPHLSETIYSPSLPDVARTLHVSAHLAELTLGIYFVGFALGTFLWGCLSDRFGRRYAMLSGLITYIVGCIGCLNSNSIEALFFFRVLQAFGASAGSVVTLTILRDLYTGKERMQIFAIIAMAITASPAIGPIIGGYISELFGWQANFTALIIIGVSLLVACIFFLQETKSKDTKTVALRDLKTLSLLMIQDKHVMSCAVLIGAVNGILFSFFGEAPFIFTELLGLTPSQYGLVGLGIAFAELVAALVSHQLATVLKAEKLIRIGANISLLGAILFCVAAFMGLLDAQYGYKAIIAANLPIVILFFGVGLIIPNALSIALKDYGKVLGSAGSILGSIYYVIIALTTGAMSFLHNGSVLPMPLYFLALASLLVWVGRSLFKGADEEVVQLNAT
jgi:Bcr/CflA subfamily drug resistance transporter